MMNITLIDFNKINQSYSIFILLYELAFLEMGKHF
jgi:hypothetical protein